MNVSFCQTQVLSIAIETIGVLVLFLFWIQGVMRPECKVLCFLKITPSVEFHDFPLVLCRFFLVFSCSSPFSSSQKAPIHSTAPCTFLSFSYSLICSPSAYYFHPSSRISMLGMPSPDLSPWIQSQIYNCSIWVFYSCLKFNIQNICPFSLTNCLFP